jgi:hypothetical protein
MIIQCKKRVEIKQGDKKWSLMPGFIGEVPAWAQEHWYFKALCKDGSITAIVASEEKPKPQIAPSADKETERKRLIDEAKNAAKLEAEADALTNGYDVATAHKHLKEKQKAAVAALKAQFDAEDTAESAPEEDSDE